MTTSGNLTLSVRHERAVEIPAFVRALRRGARRMLERALHAVRRHRARKALSRQWMPRSVLFICHGNVCRSPYAAAVFAQATPLTGPTAIRVSSAGFIGPYRESPPEALAAAQRRGVDLRAHRSALVQGDHARDANVVVVMSSDQASAIRRRVTRRNGGAPPPAVVVLGDLDPLPIDERTIQDPWNGDAAAFDASFARIDRCVHELIRLLLRDHVH